MDNIFLRRQIISVFFLIFPGIVQLFSYPFREFLVSDLVGVNILIALGFLSFLSSLIALKRFITDYRRELGFSRSIFAIFIVLAVGGVYWTGSQFLAYSGLVFFFAAWLFGSSGF